MIPCGVRLCRPGFGEVVCVNLPNAVGRSVSAVPTAWPGGACSVAWAAHGLETTYVLLQCVQNCVQCALCRSSRSRQSIRRNRVSLGFAAHAGSRSQGHSRAGTAQLVVVMRERRAHSLCWRRGSVAPIARESAACRASTGSCQGWDQWSIGASVQQSVQGGSRCTASASASCTSSCPSSRSTNPLANVSIAATALASSAPTQRFTVGAGSLSGCLCFAGMSSPSTASATTE